MDNSSNQNFEKGTSSASSLLHGSKSESNLFSFHKSGVAMDTTSNSGLNAATSMQIVPDNRDLEDMVTSTPAPTASAVHDHQFQTPRRGAVFSKSSAGSSSKSSSKNCIRYVRSSSENTSRTPSSGPRLNPFDSHISVDRLHLPTCSPSVFSTVVSPSQEIMGSSASGSEKSIWTLDQQARLFPAQISDDSPWKQEAASSRLDQDTENRTQEALDLYFSQHHHVTTPEDVPLISVSSLQNRSSMGNSPNLTSAGLETAASQGADKSDTNYSSGSTSISYDQSQTCRSTQTWLTFPAILPSDLENMLIKYGLVNSTAPGEDTKTLAPSAIAWAKRNSNTSEGNISNSTLRRKLFAGMIQDDDDTDVDESDDGNDFSDDKDSKLPWTENKENCESTAMVVSPGKIMMTPNAQRIPSSPNKSVSTFNIKIYTRYILCSIY